MEEEVKNTEGMDKKTLANILSEYNVDYHKVKAFFLKHDLGRIISPDTILSDEQYNAFCKRFKSKKKEANSATKDKNKVGVTTNKTRKLPSKSKLDGMEIMTADRSFTSCAREFRNSKVNLLNRLYNELIMMLGDSFFNDAIPLFHSMKTNKYNVVSYDYYYYTLSWRKKLVPKTCMATWIACFLSEAVNNDLLSKYDYSQLYKDHLRAYLGTLKRKKIGKKRWYSVVSVPFGGMNKRR